MPTLKYLLSFSLLALSSLASAQVVLPLVGDAANSSAPGFNSSIANTLNDGFTYDPLDPTSSPPTLVFSTSTPLGYHAAEPNSGLVTLTYTLDQPFPDDGLLRQLALDLWGRDGDSNATIESRDDDFDIEIFDGATSLSKLTSLGIDGDHHSRADFGLLPLGANVTKIVVTARQSQTGANSTTGNAFTLMEIRAAVFIQAPIIVTTLADELDEPAGNDLSLREAIRDALPTSVITFAPALNGGTIQLDASLGQLRINKALTIDASALTDGIIIDGGSNDDSNKDANETRCFFISGGGATKLEVMLNNLTIRKGVVGGVTAMGANIDNRENLTLINCQILDGRALGQESGGGGLANQGGSIELIGCRVSGNLTQQNDSEGGGVHNRDGNLTMTACTVSGNQTQGDFAEAGGVFNIDGNLTMTACTISGNQTQGDATGGGVHNTRGNLTMTACTISGNQAQGRFSRGGGIFSNTNFTNQTTRLIRCTISENTALNDDGGGFFNAGGRTIIEHCTIVGNSASNGEGAGIANDGNSDTETSISHSIIRDNSDGFDLALVSGSTNSFIFSGENLIDTLEAGITGTPTNTDPILLAPLGDYGGPTETMPPLAGSPAIDAATGSTNTTDQRGFLIIGTPDIGAAEFFSSLITVVTTTIDELDPIGTDGTGISLREAIRDTEAGGFIIFAQELNGGQIDLDATLGELVVDKSLTIDASDLPNGIIIDGGSNGDFVLDNSETRCFSISDGDITIKLEVTLNHLTIQNGVFEGGNAGANIFSLEKLTLIDCAILNGRGVGNSAFGGGILSSTGELTLTNCTVSGNQTLGRNAQGGGIFSAVGNLTMTACTISGNQTEGENADGGGIFSTVGNITMTDCTVSGNQSLGRNADGSGVFSAVGNLTMTACTVSGNQSQGEGAQGGGVYIFSNSENEIARLTRCTISGNTALNANGGGLFNERGRTIIEHCTIVGNSTESGEGAGITSEFDASTSTEISHSIIQDNFGGFDLALHDSETGNPFLLTGENLIGTVGAGIDGVTLNTDPILLAPLANYGGPTETMPPLFGSPAIDAATASTATEDQRGFLIIGIPDIGAAEAQGDEGLFIDADGDGLVGLLELALGTDPNVADFENPARPALGFDASGAPAITFGRGSAFLPGTILIIERSTDLQSFEEIYRFDFDAATSTLGTSITEDLQATQFIITDETENQPRAFYRLTAILAD